MVEYAHTTKRPSDRCMYPSKQCHNKRANKLNGQPHKLCEEHRQQANRNQKRLQQRRRMRQFQEMQMYVLDTFAQTPEPSHARAYVTPLAEEISPPVSENANPNAPANTFWGFYQDEDDSHAVAVLSPLRLDDDERLREFAPEDVYILQALLLDTA